MADSPVYPEKASEFLTPGDPCYAQCPAVDSATPPAQTPLFHGPSDPRHDRQVPPQADGRRPPVQRGRPSMSTRVCTDSNPAEVSTSWTAGACVQPCSNSNHPPGLIREGAPATMRAMSAKPSSAATSAVRGSCTSAS